MNSKKTDDSTTNIGANGDNISDDGMYEFLNNYYKEFNPVG